MEHKKNDTSWGKVSGWYDGVVENPESYQQSVIMPNLLRILSPKKNLRILDLGCGTGVFSRAFGDTGAFVDGVDLGKELINIAKQKSEKYKNIKYIISSADDLSVLNDNSYDVVTVVLALQNMKSLDKVVKEISTKLANGGRLILVLNHPAFRIPQWSDWYFDDKKKLQSRVVGKYMSEIEIPILMNPGDPKSKKTFSFHRPMQVYVKAFAKEKLYITRLEEWISHKISQAGPKKNIEDVSRKEIPMFMCLELTKF